VKGVAGVRAEIAGAASGFFDDEVALSAHLQPVTGAARANDVLLTGATGLVGTYMVRELSERTDRTIFCIVRAADEHAAEARLRGRLAALGVDPSIVGERVRGLPGNVAAPHFGLAPNVYADLADRIGVVFHNAARLNFLQTYRALRRVNVGGVQRAIEFAAIGARKRIAYTSTAAVLESSARGPGVASEDAPLTFPEALAAGYAQTKWVAEAMLDAAGERGFDVAIFRPPWILETGTLPAPDFVVRFVEACRQIGALPDSRYRWNLVPAGYVARALVALALADGTGARIAHLGNAETLTNRELAPLLAGDGVGLPVIPVELWRERLRAALAGRRDNPLRPLGALFFRQTAINGTSIPADTYLYGRVPVMDSRRTIARLSGLGVAGPTIDASLLGGLAWRGGAPGTGRDPGPRGARTHRKPIKPDDRPQAAKP
jgi:myxalamid-type nonribosomal peptide synthetase MxaA